MSQDLAGTSDYLKRVVTLRHDEKTIFGRVSNPRKRLKKAM
jgi:hypothetical protein